MTFLIMVFALSFAVSGAEPGKPEILKPDYKGKHAQAVNDARASLLAFTCAFLDPQDDKMNIAMKRGARFLDWTKITPQVDLDKVNHTLIPRKWNLVGRGPTNDFVLGRLSQLVVDSEYDEVKNLDTTAKRKKFAEKYRALECDKITE